MEADTLKVKSQREQEVKEQIAKKLDDAEEEARVLQKGCNKQ